MNTLNETERKILDSIHKGVFEDRGKDYVYSTGEGNCFYNEYDIRPNWFGDARTKDGNEEYTHKITGIGCIVGYGVLDSSLATPDEVRAREGQAADVLLNPYIDPLVSGLSEGYVFALSQAQQVQDDGGTWGDAWAKMLRVLKDHDYDTSEYDTKG